MPMRITRVITVVTETVETLVIWRAATGTPVMTPREIEPPVATGTGGVSREEQVDDKATGHGNTKRGDRS